MCTMQEQRGIIASLTNSGIRIMRKTAQEVPGYTIYYSDPGEIDTIMAQGHEYDVYKIGWSGPNSGARRVMFTSDERGNRKFERKMRALNFEIQDIAA